MDQINLLAVSADRWLPVLAETTLRATVIVLVAAGIALALRRGSATLRHQVWALGLAGALVAPLGATYLPAVDLPMPGFLRALATSAAFSSPIPESSGLPSRSGARELTDVSVTQSMGGPDGSASAQMPEMASRMSVAPTTGPASAPGSDRVPSTLPWPILALGVWLVGAGALLIRIGVGFLAARRLERHAEPPSDVEWTRLGEELAATLRVPRPVRVLSSARAAMPMTWGWRRPVVLVPATGDWSTARKRVVLLHELSHVERHDCAWQLVANLACAAYWFNPLVWVAVRAQRVERERACDEAVVLAGTQASSYADHLLDIARLHREPRWSSIAAVAMARRSQLEGRLLSILAAGRRPRASRRMVLGVTTLMAVAIASLAAVTPTTGVETVGVATAEVVTRPATAPKVLESPAPLAAQEPRPEEAAVVEAALEETRAELSELQRQFDEQTRALSGASNQATAALETRRRELEREVAALEAKKLDMEQLRQSREGQQALRVADLEARLRLAQTEAAEFIRRRDEWEFDLPDTFVLPDLDVAEQALRYVQEFQQEDLRRVVDDVRIAEDVRIRVQDQLARVRTRVSAGRAPLDPRVASLLLGSLSDDAPEVRERAARGLGRNRVSDAVGPLSDALRDSDATVREAAAWALGRLRAETAVGPLTGAVDDPEANVVEQVVRALGMIGSESSVGALGSALGAETPRVRAAAAWALGRLRSAEAVPALSAALADAEPGVRAEVVEALGRIRDVAAVSPLVGALEDTAPRIRREAAEALGRLRDAGGVDGLVRALADVDPSVAEQAAEALGRIREPAAVDGLVAALEHTHADVVEAAAGALGRIRSDRAVDGLVSALRTAEAGAAEEVIQALGRIGGDRALEALIEATDNASPAVRGAVIEALSERRWSTGAEPRPNPNPDPNPNRE